VPVRIALETVGIFLCIAFPAAVIWNDITDLFAKCGIFNILVLGNRKLNQ